MIIPIGHDKGIRRLPFVTAAIILACILVQIQLALDGESDLVFRWGYTPAGGFGVNAFLSSIVHGGWLHLVFNVLFLWMCGANIEDRWGHVVFGLLWLSGAAGSAVAYGLWNPDSTIPVVGASGAIAACMGAFLVCYHSTRIRFWFWWYLRAGTFEARALYVLPIWFAGELFWSSFEDLDGVAHSAHVGGFVVGFAFALVLKWSGLEKKHLMLLQEVADEHFDKRVKK